MVIRGNMRNVVAALIAVAMLCALLVYAAGHADASEKRCRDHRIESTQRGRIVTGTGRDVLVIGDSWSVGLGLDDLSKSWPSRLEGQVRVAGFSGSGFSATASNCGNVSFGTRAAAANKHRADLVVIEGGLNDFDRTDAAIERGFRLLMTTLRGTPVVVLGPAAAPRRPAKAMTRVEATLRRLSAEYDVPYVATSDLDLPYLDDRLHLTAAGHAKFGDAVAVRLGEVSGRVPTPVAGTDTPAT